jgi:hypothetical protein
MSVASPEGPEMKALEARFRQFHMDMLAEDRWDCCQIPAEFDALKEGQHGRR